MTGEPGEVFATAFEGRQGLTPILANSGAVTIEDDLFMTYSSRPLLPQLQIHVMFLSFPVFSLLGERQEANYKYAWGHDYIFAYPQRHPNRPCSLTL